MKLVKYDKFLEEVSLNLPLLRSERNGKQRGNTLVKKLKEEDPELTLDDNTKVDINTDTKKGITAKQIAKEISNTKGDYDSEKAISVFAPGKRYIDVIKDENGKEYKLNQFKKDTSFGSSGAGVNTRSYENLQCIYLAHKLVRPNEELTNENIVRLLADYKDKGNVIANMLKLHLPNTDNVDDILVSALGNPDWATTLIDVTNDLYEFSSLDKRLFKEKFEGKYHVYHISSRDDDSPFNLIRNKFKDLLKKEPLSSKLDIEFSKYCPADVMVVVNDINLKNLINVGSINELSNVLNTLFSERTLIPISLKKVGVTKNSVKTYSIIVNNELLRPLPEFEIESFSIYGDIERGIGSKIKVNSSWKDGKGNEIDGEDRFLTIDSSNTSNKINVDGEVEGKFSRHGKISFPYMKYFINSIRSEIVLDEFQVLEEYSILNGLTEKELVSKIEDILIHLHNLKRNVSKIVYPKRKNKEISTGRPIGSNNRKNKLISKLQSLQLVNAIIQVREVDVEKGDIIINKIMRYALSIEADIFTTPRYLRVI
jgi:hypothetical protein